jgi:hypothetical protein
MVIEIVWPASASASNTNWATSPMAIPKTICWAATSRPAAVNIESEAGTAASGASNAPSEMASTMRTRRGTAAALMTGATSMKPEMRRKGQNA